MEEKYKIGNLETVSLLFDKNLSYTKTIDRILKNLEQVSSSLNMITNTIKPQISGISSALNIISSSMTHYQRIQNLLPNSLSILSDNIKLSLLNIQKIDFIPILNYFKEFNYAEINVDNNSSKEEIVENITSATIEIVTTPNLTTRKKRNFFKAFINSLGGKIIIYVFCLIFSALANESIIKHHAILEAKYEIVQLEKEQENKEAKLNYRYIIKETRLYKNRKLKTKIDDLAVGEIVIVLGQDKEKLKVQILDTNEIGWILKKYSKKC